MKVWYLTATRLGRSQTIRLYEEQEWQAILGGMCEVLKRAEGSLLWRRGKIVLTSEDGRVIQTMKEKGIKS
jgi:hypothetical protein